MSALYYIETQLIELALKKGKVDLVSKIISGAVQPDFIEPNMLLIRNKYLQHYFEKKGDYKNAYKYQMNNTHMDDSIRNERIKMCSAEISLKYKQDSTLMKKEFFIKEKKVRLLCYTNGFTFWCWALFSLFHCPVYSLYIESVELTKESGICKGYQFITT